MSSKDYVAIATEIRATNLTAHRTVSGEAYAAVSAALARVADGLCDVFVADNPLFDRERFKRQCDDRRVS